MKNLPLILASFMLVLFFACGSDTATNQTPGTGEEVIFSMDSFAINLEYTLTVKDTNIVLSDAPNVKINFNCSTNADSVNSFVHFRLSVADSSSVFLDTINNHISKLNNTFVFQSIASGLSIVRFYIQASRVNNEPCFITLTNIKISTN